MCATAAGAGARRTAMRDFLLTFLATVLVLGSLIVSIASLII
jgi:hypothetical protein